MGDISRHRDIYLFTRHAVPTSLLARNRLTAADLTYLELGNFLTDVSQFRDPVSYIFAKQRIWRDMIIPQTEDKLRLVRILAALGGAASLAASQYLRSLTSGALATVTQLGGAGLAAAGEVIAGLPTEFLADVAGADEWLDAMLGSPVEKAPGDPKRQEERHYGLLGQYFRHFIEGVTQLLFAQDVKERVKGEWGQIEPISEVRVSEVFGEFFTQYYPHEHTDQPPYVWDASRRPSQPDMYGPSRRQRSLQDPDIGVMNAVDKHYVQYLAEELSDVEQRWRELKPADTTGRQRLLVRMGKLLHGIEDWFFHSNVSEILRLRGHTPRRAAAESDEQFLRRFVTEVAKNEPEFVAANATERLRLTRKLYRRLRFPVYERGTGNESAGRLSKSRPSTPSLRHAYPAFPSQQDTAHTLMHALENLEHKLVHPGVGGRDKHTNDVLAGGLPSWVPCVIGKFTQSDTGDGRRLLAAKAAARGVSVTDVAAALAGPGRERAQVRAVLIDLLREWLPLVLTLVDESERQRLAANVGPLEWPPDNAASPAARPATPAAPAPGSTPGSTSGTTQLDRQQELHRLALVPKPSDAGLVENNYERAVRYATECGFLNARGQQAIVKALTIDQASQRLLAGAPGTGAFLMRFLIELQHALDAGDAATVKLDADKDSAFGQASDNGAFNEIVGSHSLMSKDTLASTPFFEQARVLATVASSSVLTVMLEQVGTPTAGRQLVWTEVLHHFIRYPPSSGGWERRAIAFHRQNGRIPSYADLPELARLVASLKRPPPPPTARRQSKREELEERYRRLEGELSKYRYP